MFYIKKYIEGFAIHNDESGKSRLLSEQEKQKALEVYPALLDKSTIRIFTDSPLFCI
ncbi:MAG: hypothetical protein PF693_15260 [Spirochaetia bacterium]|jgi:hypothetical protein|nr:hypothetical protein [Spirochaetia bacterium]